MFLADQHVYRNVTIVNNGLEICQKMTLESHHSERWLVGPTGVIRFVASYVWGIGYGGPVEESLNYREPSPQSLSRPEF